MGAITGVVLLVTLIGLSHGQMMRSDWLSGLNDNLNHLHENIQESIRRTNERIQENVRSTLAHVHRVNQDALKRASKLRDHTVSLNNGNSHSIVIGGNGSSRTVVSGQNSDGEKYYRETEDRIIGNVLHHTDRVYNPTRKSLDTYSYTLDLKDPNAKPIPVVNDEPFPVPNGEPKN